jgi:UDPglucose--hexose-1-phosphate uridylyltransferase
VQDAFLQASHRRWNSLKREWVLVSPISPGARGRARPRLLRRPLPSPMILHATFARGNLRAGGGAHPRLQEHLRLRERLRRSEARSARSYPQSWRRPDSRNDRTRHLPRALLQSPTRPHLATMDVAAIRRVVDIWARSGTRTCWPPKHPLCPDIREPWTYDGCKLPRPCQTTSSVETRPD